MYFRKALKKFGKPTSLAVEVRFDGRHLQPSAFNLRRYLAIACLAVVLLPANRLHIASAQGQIATPKPPIPTGDVSIYLSSFVTGLPVEQEFLTPVFTQRVGPTDLAEVPDGSGDLVLTNYGGTAYRLDSAGRMPDQPFLDLLNPASSSYSPNFEFGGAHGLTSIAFHPRFNDPLHLGHRKFYTIEPETSGSGVSDFVESIIPGDHHQEAVYEYTLETTDALSCLSACAASKRALLRVQQPGWHHNLGDLLFDDAGILYVSSADGNVGGRVPPVMSDNSQVLNNVFGKILRIDPFGTNSTNGQYGIPNDNPFVDGEGSNLDEIYAYGLRNPFRIDFDLETGEMYASETGEISIESVERITRGGNFGWNLKEGSYLFDRRTREVSDDFDFDENGRGDVAQAHDLIEPVIEYDRDEGRAVVGAVPFRGDSLPKLDGKIIFADFIGRLFHGDPTTGEPYHALIDPQGGALPYNIHSVNQDSDGDVYLLGITRENDVFDGVIMKLFATPTTVGDTNGDGALNSADIDLLTKLVREESRETQFDLSGDGVLNNLDRLFLIDNIFQTSLGDANLDGRWTSTDLVIVFQAGEYEDEKPNNSGWSEGDWNGDGDFTSRDFVVALQRNSYGDDNAAILVPEPVFGANLTLPVLLALLVRRRYC